MLLLTQPKTQYVPYFNSVGHLSTIYASFPSPLISCELKQEGKLPLQTSFQTADDRGNECLPLVRNEAPQTRLWNTMRYRRATLQRHRHPII